MLLMAKLSPQPQEKQPRRRKDLLCLRVTEVSVDDCSALLLPGLMLARLSRRGAHGGAKRITSQQASGRERGNRGALDPSESCLQSSTFSAI